MKKCISFYFYEEKVYVQFNTKISTRIQKFKKRRSICLRFLNVDL